MNDWMNFIETATGSFRIRDGSVLAWMQCCCPALRSKARGTGTGSGYRNRDHTNSAGGKDQRGTFYRAGNSAGECRYGGAKRRLQSSGREITIVTGDIKEASVRFGAGSFEVITTNPPYMIGQHGIQNDANAKTIARHEVLCDLDDILRESAKMLKQGGRFTWYTGPSALRKF